MQVPIQSPVSASLIDTAVSRRNVLRLVAVGSFVGSGAVPAHAVALEAGEGALVFPSTARLLPDGKMSVRVEAWVFERESRRFTAKVLAKLLGLDWDSLSVQERELYGARTTLFGQEAQRGRRLLVQVGSSDAVPLGLSDKTGRLGAALVVPKSQVIGPGMGNVISIRLSSQERGFPGRAYWHDAYDAQGLSVVSDIDDTIKHTDVTNTREMLRNTFARPFAPVPGMADWYTRIQKTHRTAAFHYVSGSPYPLLPPLQDFLNVHQFQAGSVHLRWLPLRPNALLDREATSRHKTVVIQQLLGDFSQRRFVLVGDSGEYDPEVYGALARANPRRIAAILIRDVTGEGKDAPRYAQAFATLPTTQWRLFTDPASLPTQWW